MTVFIIVVACVAWHAIGVFIAIRRWTLFYDFLGGDIIMAIIVGASGPFAFVVMYIALGRLDGERLPLFKQRTR